MSPFGIVLLFILVAALAAVVARSVWLKKRVKTGATWPTTEAIVQSSEEVVASTRGGDVDILCFTFSYVVNGEYHSGRFELMPNPDSAASILSRMKGQKFRVHYDPVKPADYYIPHEQTEAWEVND